MPSSAMQPALPCAIAHDSVGNTGTGGGCNQWNMIGIITALDHPALPKGTLGRYLAGPKRLADARKVDVRWQGKGDPSYQILHGSSNHQDTLIYRRGRILGSLLDGGWGFLRYRINGPISFCGFGSPFKIARPVKHLVPSQGERHPGDIAYFFATAFGTPAIGHLFVPSCKRKSLIYQHLSMSELLPSTGYHRHTLYSYGRHHNHITIHFVWK